MDAAHLHGIERDLVAWGVLEDEGAVQATRRFRAAMMRAAAALQANEKSPGQPSGHPVENVVRLALSDWTLPAGAILTSTHVAFVVALEIESLPPAVRELLGLSGGPGTPPSSPPGP